MPNLTPIEWADYSSNPVKYRDRETGKVVWGCVKKSAGCANCYAEALALRWHKGLAFSRPNIDKVAPFLDEKELAALARDPRLAGTRVFVGDMTDLFGSWIPDDLLDRLFAAFAWRQDVTFLLLTKRPARMAAWFAERFQYVRQDGGIGWHGREDRVFEAMLEAEYADPNRDGDWTAEGDYRWPGWPLPNVWLGTSTEDQRAADERIPHLLATPAAVRWLSMEPLLGPVDLSPWLCSDGLMCLKAPWLLTHVCPANRLDWIVAGGESGARHRPLDLAWARSLRDQCAAAGVPYFFKQVGGRTPKAGGRELDGRVWSELPKIGTEVPA
jgi:protein gp37